MRLIKDAKIAIHFFAQKIIKAISLNQKLQKKILIIFFLFEGILPSSNCNVSKQIFAPTSITFHYLFKFIKQSSVFPSYSRYLCDTTRFLHLAEERKKSLFHL